MAERVLGGQLSVGEAGSATGRRRDEDESDVGEGTVEDSLGGRGRRRRFRGDVRLRLGLVLGQRGGGEGEETWAVERLSVAKGHLGRAKELDCPLDTNTRFEHLWNLWDSTEFSLTFLRIRHSTAFEDGEEDVNLYSTLPTLPPLTLDISSLTQLTLFGFLFAEGSSLLPLLQRIPNLKRLELPYCSVDFSFGDATPSNPTIISLPNLTTLVIQNSAGGPPLRNRSSTIFLLPNLRALLQTLEEIPLHLILFPPSPHPPNTTHLRYLDVENNEIIDETILLEQLTRLPALEELNVAYTSVTNETVRRLVWSPSEKDNEGRLCPLLKKLKIFGGGKAITGEGLVRMVTSRKAGFLRGREEGRGEGGCAAIEALIMEGRRSGLTDLQKELIKEQVGKLVCQR